MTKRQAYDLPEAPDRPAIWRTLEEKNDPGKRAREAVEETGVQLGSLLPSDSLVGRRSFFKVTGATAAAVGLSGCLRRPAEQILPYSRAPEYTLPGISLHYATSMSHRGDAVGLLVESHEGRPTKIEGNPDHPRSAGATDAAIQGRILDLYDNDRSGQVTNGESDASWSDWDTFWREKATALERAGGRGLRVLAAPSDSPSFLRARAALIARFPEARVHHYAPVGYDNIREGTRLAFGAYLTPQVNYENAKRVVALDSDFLSGEPGAIVAARAFADARRVRSASDDMNRLYVVEGTLTVTGMNADHRLRLAPSKVDGYLRALAKHIGAAPNVPMPPAVTRAVASAEAPAGVPEAWIAKVADDLLQHRGESVITVGHRQPPHVHALAHAINMALGNAGPVVGFYPAADPEETAGIAELVEAMNEGDVSTLVILGGNPVYDAPADLGFAAALERVEATVHLADRPDETSAACMWHLPMTHELESWGDHRAADGTVSIQQPLIAPIRGGRSAAEVLAQMGGIRGWRGYHLVRGTMRAGVGPDLLDRLWRRSLHRGVVIGLPRLRPRTPPLADADVATALGEAPAAGEGWEAVFLPSYQVFDGSQANNAWLLEMPDPVTKIVWDNAAYVSPASAESLGVSNGDMLTIAAEGGEVSVPAFVLPGHADEVVTLPLGFGRTAAGSQGDGVGFDVYPLRTSDAMGFRTGVSVRAGSGTHTLVQTQDHHSMEGRPLAIDATLEEYKERPDFTQWPDHGGEPTPSLGPLWTQVDYSQPRQPAHGGTSYSLMPEDNQPRPDAPPRYKWGYVIDLTTCTGCSACVVACQAENNITTVGKRQVQLGREMHWMRLDRYFVGDDEANPQVALQPVGCQHCEEAPCENVCPVNATAHSPEGLNDMAYNRCIGTRYCMNNCPYKVRRFNFLDYYGDIPQTRRMQFNPNVTVRMRGVMEKCSYCVQRIQAARIEARRRTTVDEQGEISETRITAADVVPACAQACPSQAITFGDLNDTGSEVHRLAHLDRRYSLLAQVGTQPRTTYLGKLRNPNSEMV